MNYLLIDSPEEINVFIQNLRDTSTFNITSSDQGSENQASAALRTNLLNYSYEKENVLLTDFQLNHLPLPLRFDHIAMLHDYLQQKDAGQAHVFDHQKNAIAQICANFKRILGFDQAKAKLVPSSTHLITMA